MSIPAEVLIDHFLGIFYTDREPLSFMDPGWRFNSNSADGAFNDSELLTALDDLNGQAAVGPERILSSVLKEVFKDPATRAPLLALMNLCFYEGKVPMEWGFADAMGLVGFESVRVVLLFLGDVIRFSMGASSSECPFCPIQLHASHFFLCPNTPFRRELPNWQSFIRSFKDNQWRSFIFVLFVCLRLWANRTNFFSASGKERVLGFFNGEDQ